MHKKQCLPDTKVWIFKNVHKPESCTVGFMKYVQSGFSFTQVSPFLHHTSLTEIKTRNNPNMTSSVCFPYLCACTKLRIMGKKGRLQGTPEQLVHNVHRLPSFPKVQVMLNILAHAARKRKARFRCYLPLSAQKKSNQDGLLSDLTESKVKHSSAHGNFVTWG